MDEIRLLPPPEVPEWMVEQEARREQRSAAAEHAAGRGRGELTRLDVIFANIDGKPIRPRKRPRPEQSKQELADYLRDRMTPAERAVWPVLQSLREDGLYFAASVPVLGWIADFYEPTQRIVVEVDGGYHELADQKRLDRFRDQTMNRAGIKVVRVPNQVALSAPERIVTEIAEALLCG